MAHDQRSVADLIQYPEAILPYTFLRAGVGNVALDGPFEESVTLNAMPTRNDIIAAITNLRNTKLERDKAYEALSEIERGYVDHADGLPTFGEYAHDDKD